jgi:transposase
MSERIQHSNRIKGLLFSQGITTYSPTGRDRRAKLDTLTTGDGRPLPHGMKQQIARELDRLEQVIAQLAAIEEERDAMLAAERGEDSSVVSMLTKVVGVGPEFAAVLWSEGLFRHFDNRRQVAAYAGLAPTPWQSGTVSREQGVSKSGNGRLRSTLIQLAWLWIRHQPASELAKWFRARVAQNGGRMKKTMITALARKLLVALWKYATAGVVIEGAAMRA